MSEFRSQWNRDLSADPSPQEALETAAEIGRADDASPEGSFDVGPEEVREPHESPSEKVMEPLASPPSSNSPARPNSPSRLNSPGRPSFGQPGRLTASPAAGQPATTPESRIAQRGLAAPEWQGRGQHGPRIIAVANQKGGVGKTTTAVNFGAAAAELGHRVLIIDLDPQGNASTGLGINPRGLESSMYDVLLHDVPLDEAIEAAEVKNLFIAPANLDLAGAEIELVPAFSREMRLKNAINTVAADFDLVLIDCPPSLGLLTVNAFAAASEVMVPIQCEYYALEGLGQLMRNVDLVRRNLNADLELSAIVLVMYDARTNLSAQVAGEVREHFGPKVCRAVIPRNIRLSEAPSFGQPITVFDPSSRGAIAYRDLAKEVMGEPT